MASYGNFVVAGGDAGTAVISSNGGKSKQCYESNINCLGQYNDDENSTDFPILLTHLSSPDAQRYSSLLSLSPFRFLLFFFFFFCFYRINMEIYDCGITTRSNHSVSCCDCFN